MLFRSDPAPHSLDLSYETVRRWVLKFGPGIARRLRRSRPRASDRWQLDEMVVRIAGKHMYLWRAVDHEGEVLDMLVQRRRDKRAAVRLMRKLLRRQGFAPKLMTTDKLGSYGAALLHLRLACPREQGHQKEQPRGEFSSTRPSARAQNAALQVSSIRPALPEHPCRRLQHLQSLKTPDLPIHAADLQNRSGSAMAGRRHRCINPDRPFLYFTLGSLP